MTQQLVSKTPHPNLATMFMFPCNHGFESKPTGHPTFFSIQKTDSQIHCPLGRKGLRDSRTPAKFRWNSTCIGVLFGCVGKQWMAIPGLPGGLLIYQENPSISPRTSMALLFASKRGVGHQPRGHLQPTRGA